jgi:hypothetical protein
MIEDFFTGEVIVVEKKGALGTVNLALGGLGGILLMACSPR